MGKCKTKSIQTGIIRELFGHVQAYSEPCVTLAYLEPWYIHNLEIFRTRSILTTLAYSQPWYNQNAGIFKIRGILRTLSNIYDKAFCENS